MSKNTGDIPEARVSPFDSIRHTSDVGDDYWSARELAAVLGYRQSYRNFLPVIAKAETACEQSGFPVSDHFARMRTKVNLGSGAQREVDDVHLSRYACYLVVQNGDPGKPIIASGQTYFAVQTRKQELEQELARLPDAQKRIAIRKELAEQNKRTAATVYGAGVLTSRDFAVFQDHGYRGLYNGETARDIAARKGLPKGQAILDWMGSTELAANLFRSTQAEDKIRREGITNKADANRTHHTVGAIVRRVIIDDLGGTPPEQLPTPTESIQQLEAYERQRLESERQPSLFPELEGNEE